MNNKFVSMSVKPDTRKVIRSIAVERDMRIYEVVEKLVKNAKIVLD
jgi:hypothetical protein